MGFLRRLFCRNFTDVNEALRSFDERISKIEGVGGQFEPKRDINANNNRIKSLKAPIDVSDAARYNKSTRMKTLSFFMYGLIPSSTSYVLGYYKVPMDMKIERVTLGASQVAWVDATYTLGITILNFTTSLYMGIDSQQTMVITPQGVIPLPYPQRSIDYISQDDGGLYSGGTCSTGDELVFGIAAFGVAGQNIWRDVYVYIDYETVDR